MLVIDVDAVIRDCEREMTKYEADALRKPMSNTSPNSYFNWAVWKSFKEYLLKIPTIEVEPERRGRWIPIYELTSEGILPDEPMGYMCDQCKAKRRKRLNYCSNCGARMDGDEK